MAHAIGMTIMERPIVPIIVQFFKSSLGREILVILEVLLRITLKTHPFLMKAYTPLNLTI